MTQARIDAVVKLIMSLYADFMPSNGYKVQALQAQRAKQNIPGQLFNTVLNLLLLNGYLDMPNDGRISYFVQLTDKGYAYIKGEIPFVLEVNLRELTYLSNKNRERTFYQLWDFIGDGDSTTNSYYVTGPEFYNVCKNFIGGLPPTYTEYMKIISEKDGSKPSRSVWCKALFVQIPDSDMETFMDNLSVMINRKMTKLTQAPETDDDLENFFSAPNNNTMGKSKIFISHNEQDAPFAHALVD